MIEQLKIKNFMAFSDELTVNFSPKINVIIGENGTGKTQLLKSIYGIYTTGINISATPIQEYISGTYQELYTKYFIDLFLPLDRKIGKLHHAGAVEQTSIVFNTEKGHFLTIKFHNNSQKISFEYVGEHQQETESAIFIPTKEVISFAEGFVSLYEKYKLSFDITYRDICLSLDHPVLRSENIQEKSMWAIEEIEKICGGKFIFYGGGRVTFKTPDGTEYSANAIAEGFRKIGILARHLETGIITPGVSGPLLWDEPEANMNPKLMRLLVEVLLALSRNGQQIILTTHDYVLLKWFDLLMDKGKGDHVRYHMLYRQDDSQAIAIHSIDDYTAIHKSSILDTFSELYDADIARALG